MKCSAGSASAQALGAQDGPSFWSASPPPGHGLSNHAFYTPVLSGVFLNKGAKLSHSSVDLFEEVGKVKNCYVGRVFLDRITDTF